jgi:phenylalanyl-tRNA synthetase beta chain
MNALVSYAWLKEFVDLKGISAEDFAKRISLSGPAVEKIHPQGVDLERVIVGKVTEIRQHPNADKLRVAIVDGGGDAALHIVCGGSNLEVGQWVPVALVGARVRWHGEGDLITLEPAEIRGVKSEGMICASDEIGLFEAFPHGEREILDLGKALAGHRWKAGQPLAEALGLAGDALLDIEVTTNRVDAMGMHGLAREAAAIFGREASVVAPKKIPSARKGSAKLPVSVASAKDCPRYMAVRVDGIAPTETPWTIKRRLLGAGIRPISFLVDIAAYVMLETSQPMHAFDAAKLQGGLSVRRAQDGESLAGLDGKAYALDANVLVIADASGPVAVAGVLGGMSTAVQPETTSVVFEAANFDAVVVRRGARRLNIQTDAQLRFEKGLSTHALPVALARAVELVLQHAGGTVTSDVVDVGKPSKLPTHRISIEEANRLIGVEVPPAEMVTTLKRLGFAAKRAGKNIEAVVPWWREHDVEEGRDLVEEIARIRGYANIPAVMPLGLAPRPDDASFQWERRLRRAAVALGLVETFSYSFISEDLARKAGFDPSRMLRLQNPLTDEFAVMRTSLLPSLLAAAAENTERTGDLRLFEMSRVYVRHPSEAMDGPWKELPDERLELGAVFAGQSESWREAKGAAEAFLAELGIVDIEWKRLATDAFWHPGRTAQAFLGGALLATVGEVAPPVAKAFKLERPAMVHIPLATVLGHANATRSYRPIPQFPEAKRDLAVVVDRHVEFADLADAVRSAVPLVREVAWFDTFEGAAVGEGKKSVAMHVSLMAPDRTLSGAEVDAALEKAVLTLRQKFAAELRG